MQYFSQIPVINGFIIGFPSLSVTFSDMSINLLIHSSKTLSPCVRRLVQPAWRSSSLLTVRLLVLLASDRKNWFGRENMMGAKEPTAQALRRRHIQFLRCVTEQKDNLAPFIESFFRIASFPRCKWTVYRTLLSIYQSSACISYPTQTIISLI